LPVAGRQPQNALVLCIMSTERERSEPSLPVQTSTRPVFVRSPAQKNLSVRCNGLIRDSVEMQRSGSSISSILKIGACCRYQDADCSGESSCSPPALRLAHHPRGILQQADCPKDRDFGSWHIPGPRLTIIGSTAGDSTRPSSDDHYTCSP
jgi:hypothetical protein